MRQPNILDYLPDVWSSIREMKAYAVAINPELEKVWQAVENAYNDQFLYSMTEDRIKRWENMLKIYPMGTDSIEDRRFRIINRLNAQLPYTYRMLEAHLIQMCGAGGYTIEYNKDTWTLIIRIGLASKKQYAEILTLIEEMIPINILLDYSLLYNKYETIGNYTHDILASYTYGSLRNELIS